MKLYLAGPMSNLPSHNYPAFAAAAKILREHGHEVISPAELHPDAATITGVSRPEDYRKYLVRDFAAIAECDGLALLPGFERSRGAWAEIHFALITGIPCYKLDSVMPDGLFALNNTLLWLHFQESLKRTGGLASLVYQDIIGERQRQDEKWGLQNHNNIWWLAILGEELGEVSQAILHDEFGGKAEGTARAELVQLAAVAAAWLECIDRQAG